MGWNGSGVFNRLYSWVADKAASIDISSTRMDADTNDITANGFGNCLTRDGQGSATANLPMNNFRHTGVGNGQARTDYAALGQIEDGVTNWAVAGGTADAITASYTPTITALIDGQMCFLRASGANTTTTPTFTPNSGTVTAHTITKIGGIAVTPGDIPGNLAEVILRYNLANTRWELLNPAAQSFFAGTAGGTANALTITDAQFQSGNAQLIQFFASATNTGATTLAVSGGSPIAIVKDAAGGPVALTGTEIAAGNFCTVAYDSANTRFHLVGGIGQIGAAQLLSSASGFGEPINLQLNATVGSNLLTVAVKGINGSDPSISNPVLVPFRDATLGNGDPVWLSLTSALSISTNATGATLGAPNSTPFRFWIVLFNNAGTAVLGLINCSSTTQIFPLDEASLQSSTGISGSATSAGVYYTPNGTSLSSKAFRIIGYLEYSSGLVTSGTYNTAPSKVQLFGPGIKKPNDIVQTKFAAASTLSITPTSAINLVMMFGNVNIVGTSSSITFVRGVTTIYTSGFGASSSIQGNIPGMVLDAPATTSSTTYSIGSTGGSTTQQTFILQEMMG